METWFLQVHQQKCCKFIFIGKFFPFGHSDYLMCCFNVLFFFFWGQCMLYFYVPKLKKTHQWPICYLVRLPGQWNKCTTDYLMCCFNVHLFFSSFFEDNVGLCCILMFQKWWQKHPHQWPICLVRLPGQSNKCTKWSVCCMYKYHYS